MRPLRLLPEVVQHLFQVRDDLVETLLHRFVGVVQRLRLTEARTQRTLRQVRVAHAARLGRRHVPDDAVELGDRPLDLTEIDLVLLSHNAQLPVDSTLLPTPCLRRQSLRTRPPPNRSSTNANPAARTYSAYRSVRCCSDSPRTSVAAWTSAESPAGPAESGFGPSAEGAVVSSLTAAAGSMTPQPTKSSRPALVRSAVCSIWVMTCL